jgi:hypothetical protein
MYAVQLSYSREKYKPVWYNSVRYTEVISNSLNAKLAVFYGVVSCSLVDTDQNFRHAYCIHHQSVSTRLQGTASLNTAILRLIAMRTRNLTKSELTQSSQAHFSLSINILCRSQWPRGLRHRSAAAWLLGSRVRIPLRAWMFVSCVVLCR